MRNIVIGLFVLLASSVNAQSRWYVASGATGSANGMSWTNAFQSLDSAFAYYQNGDTIWVKTGRYKPSGGGTNSQFQPPNGAAIYGGFSGTETMLSQRTSGVVSTLDGDIGTNGVSSDNCRRVLYFNNNTSEILLDGFKIVNGYAYTIGGSITVGGGGARVVTGKVRFRNCEFSDNYTYMRGGALAIYGSGSSVYLERCVFKNNISNSNTSSGLGGAIFCNAGYFNMTECEFKSNTAKRGGAIATYQPTVVIDRSTFSGNKAASSYGGAVDNGSESSLSIYNSLFVGNYATTGSAVYTSTTLNTKTQKYIGCTFAHNYSSNSNGYAVYTSDYTTVANCIVWGNRGKQMFNLPPAISPTVKNCLLGNDTITNGSNMYYGDPDFVNPGTASSTPFELNSMHDYGVNIGSEAVNSGDNSSVSSSYNETLYGSPRIVGGTVDIGAVESGFVDYTISGTVSPSTAGSIAGLGSSHKDSLVTLIAVPTSGCFDFVHWKEAGAVVSTNDTFTFNATADRTLVAHFSQKSFAVTLGVSPAIGGTASGDGTYLCNDDSARVLLATPAHCYKFDNWTVNGNVVSTDEEYHATLSEDVNLIANFSYAVYDVAVESDNGNVSRLGSYRCDSSARLCAVPFACYQFVNWTEAGAILGTDTCLEFKVTEDRNIKANYEKIKYAINVVASPAIGGTVSGDGEADCGSTVKLVATPKSKYTFTGWEESGTVFSTNTTYQFTASEAKNLKANFSLTGGVFSLDDMGILLYPVPVNNRLVITSPYVSIAKVELQSMQGQLLDIEVSHSGNTCTVNTQALAAGMYYVKIYTDLDVFVQQKITVVK